MIKLSTALLFVLFLLWWRFGQAIRLTHMSKASLADDEPRDGGDSQDMTSKIYTIIRDYGEYRT